LHALLGVLDSYGEQMLAWAHVLESDEVLAGLVAQAESDGDMKVVNLHAFHPVDNMGDGDLQTIADNRRLTTAFNLTGCTKLSDKGIAGMAKCCTSLKGLTLDGCSQLTDASVWALKRFTPSLQLLSLQKCHHITEPCLISLFHTCTRLTTVRARKHAAHAQAREPLLPFSAPLKRQSTLVLLPRAPASSSPGRCCLPTPVGCAR